MKSLCKLKVAAGAMLALAAVPSFAAVITTAPETFSRQGNLMNTGNFAVPTTTIALGSNAYAANDTIFVVLNGGAFDPTSTPSPTVSFNTGRNNLQGTACTALSDDPQLSVAFLNFENSSFQTLGPGDKATVARFRVTQRTGPVSSDATCEDLNLNNMQLAFSSFVSASQMGQSSVSVTYFAAFGTSDPTNPLNRFDAGVAGDLAVVEDQFFSIVNFKLDGTIDVEANRRNFSTKVGEAQPKAGGFATDGATADTLSLNLDESTGATGNVAEDGTNTKGAAFTGPGVATVTLHTITLTGDFAYLVDSDSDSFITGGSNADNGQVDVLNGAGNAIAGATVRRTNASTLVVSVPVTVAVPPGEGEVRVRFDVSTGQANPLNPTTFSVAVVDTFTNPSITPAEKTVATKAGPDAGAWDINGAVVMINWMPFGTGFSPIIQMTNKGSTTGTIVMDAFDRNGNKCNNANLGTVAGMRVVALQGLIKTALTGCSINLSDNRVAITLTVTAPNRSISVYSAYDTSTGRALVVNSSNATPTGQ